MVSLKFTTMVFSTKLFLVQQEPLFISKQVTIVNQANLSKLPLITVKFGSKTFG